MITNQNRILTWNILKLNSLIQNTNWFKELSEETNKIFQTTFASSQTVFDFEVYGSGGILEKKIFFSYEPIYFEDQRIWDALYFGRWPSKNTSKSIQLHIKGLWYEFSKYNQSTNNYYDLS